MSDLFTPEYFEKHITTVVPIINVDLIVIDNNRRILLSYRDDDNCKGWHIPGRILRFKESLNEAIIRCALLELGEVPYCTTFIDFIEFINDTETRGHFMSFAYQVSMDLNYDCNIYNTGKSETSNGFLKWFSEWPEDLIEGHKIYKRILNEKNIL